MDTQILNSHRVRCAATSVAYRSGLNIGLIRYTAGWTKGSVVFANFSSQSLLDNAEEFPNCIIRGYLKKECKYTYKVFLKYNFNSQNKHIPTRVAGQTLEDILRIYSRIEEIVQGHLEDTNYYKERSVEFSLPIYLDDQLLYLLDKDRLFTPGSTPCPRSPAESSVLESQHENEVLINNISDVETTPEHTLPGNLSSHDSNFQSKTSCRKEIKLSACTTPCIEKVSTLEKEPISEVITLKVPERSEPQKELANNINTALNTSEIPCFSDRGENERNKKGVGTELDDMLQDFLSTPIANTVNKAVSVENTSANSSNLIHNIIPSRNWHQIDDHNNRAVSSILAVANIPNNKPANLVTTLNDNIAYNDNLNNFQEPPVSSTIQTAPTSASYTSSQYLLPTSVGMYIVPQPTSSTIQSSNQQQQFYIVNQPVVIPQQPPVMQLLQPIAPANKPVLIHPTQRTPLRKENGNLSEQDIMSMPTIILNERNEITYADPGSCPTNIPFRENEAHNLKEYINLFGASDQSPILKLNSKKSGIKYQPPIKPTTTIKVEVFQCDTLPPNTAKAIKSPNTLKDNNSHSVSNPTIASIDYTGLPNLNDTIESESVTRTRAEPTKLSVSDAPTNDTNMASHDKTKSKMVSAVTPSPLKTTVRKPTPKSGSHVRNLTFPSPIRKTSEKPDSHRNSPRIINKQQATKDLFGNETDEENISNIKEEKTISKSAEKKLKQSKKESTKSPKKVTGKDKTKPSKKTTRKEIIEENTSEQEDMIPKCCWDSNLRKLIPPIIEKNNSTPIRRVSARKKARQSAELHVSDLDGKKLEEALKTPEKNEKQKRKTPSRRKKVETLKNGISEKNLESQNGETKGQTKVLSPSKLNANKRNIILSNNVNDITPSILKESAQYPISSKTRRNISNLLETPIKENFVPPTPGTIPDKTDTPFTPMLRANLKDFTEGDTFSINTPNFPVTPGLTAMVNTSAAYYILNDNENNKVTEATVLLEEKKSSVRKSDDEDFELSPTVYGSKEILENFNKNRIGKKNLELLDNRGVTWDGSSDREEKSCDNTGNNSDDESNNTVIQNQAVEPLTDILPKKGLTSGKCMATLHSNLLKEIRDQPESLAHDLELGGQEDVNANLQNDEEDKDTDEQETRKVTKRCSSGSDSEVLSKKSYAIKKGNQTEDKSPILNVESDSKMSCNVDKKIKSKIEQCTKNITGEKCTLTTQEVKQAIFDVCLKNTLDSKTTSISLKEQLEEKKKRWIKLEKAKHLNVRKTPRRSALKPSPNLISTRSKRKPLSPKKMIKSNEFDKEKEVSEDENEINKESASKIKGNEKIKKCFEKETETAEIRSKVNTEYHTVDSQDEFFIKSGTNLHRKNKGSVHAPQEDSDSRTGFKNNVQDNAETGSSADKICNDKKFSVQQENQKTFKEPVVGKNDNQEIMTVQKKDGQMSTEADNPDEFEKSWEDCRISEIQSEYEVCYQNESKRCNKKLEDYDFSILQKKILLGVPCSDDSTVNITLTVSPFDTLLEFKPPNQCETTDGSRDEADSSFETLELKSDAISDSENAGYRADNTDPKSAKKRKYRSDSCNSNSSTKRIKKNEIFNEMNIQKVLTKIHGPGPSKQQQI